MADYHTTISLPRRMYHATMPQSFRDWVNRRITAGRKTRANIRWRMKSPDARRKWAEQRLNLAESEWAFVIGLNNSGTTLLQRMLGLHPSIRSSDKEGQGMTQALPFPPRLEVGRQFTRRLDIFRWTEESDPAPALRCLFDWAHFYPRGAGYLLEKCPPDILRSRWLQANFKPARFIVTTRHPAAVCEGIVRRRPDCTIEEAARHWTVAHEVLLSDLPHLEKVHRITYEKLCEDPSATARELERFLELPTPFDTQLVSHEFNVHNMDNQPGVIQNFNKKSFDRLSDEDLATIHRIAGPIMAQFGYTPVQR